MAQNSTQMSLQRRQEALILKMATPPYPRLLKAASALGYSADTVRKWASQPQFQAALAVAYEISRQEEQAALQRGISGLVEDTIKALHEGLNDMSTTSRLRAVQIVLDRLLGKEPETLRLAGADGGTLEVKHGHRITFEEFAIGLDDLAEETARLGAAGSNGQRERVDTT